MLKAIIVDDEAHSRRTLSTLIDEYCTDIHVVGVAEDVLSGVKVINQFNPDIVFLDIEMPNYSGFKLIDFFDEIDFSIVFTTAYEEYALKAYKFPSYGYLLKPIDIDELIEVTNRLLQKHNKATNVIETDAQIGISFNTNTRKLIIPTLKGMLYLELREISHLESNGRYTLIHLISGQSVLSTSTLRDFDEILRDKLFIRIHRSYIINLTYIKKYAKGADGFVQMDNNHRIDVGKKYKEQLIEALSYFVR